ncbi:MAG: glycosyltransferase family 39 protein [Gammaproteobacteria bacterium]|nr:glycosyltransferase family 39 protein [Gammaproteobacteria bacterium]
MRSNLPMDAIEGFIWGRHFAFGYDKNPYFNGWLFGLAGLIGGHSDWVIYFISQLFVALCFWAIWRLANKLLAPISALVSVFLLELISSYNIDAIDFDDNVIELSLWALTILTFYSALKNKKVTSWLLVGLFSGLSFMTKYYAIVLLAPMLLMLVLDKSLWDHFKQPGIYLGGIVFLALTLVHILWLFSHDFVTVTYAIGRVNTEITWWAHLIKPIRFTLPLLEACILPVLVFYGVFYIGREPLRLLVEPQRITPFQRQFLLYMGIGPFITTIMLSFLFGFDLHSAWGQPLFSLLGILLVVFMKPKINAKRFYRFVVVLSIVFILALSAYAISMSRAGSTSSAHYPGRKIATNLTHEWHQRYHTPLAYVIGPRWEAGNVARYSKDHPTVYMEADPVASFWINKKELQNKGALVVWDATKSRAQQFKKSLKHLHHWRIETFYWDRDNSKKPIKIGVAFYPPHAVGL